MSDRLETLLQMITSRFNAGRPEDMARLFSDRLPVYSRDGFVLKLSRDETTRAIREVMDAARMAGTDHLRYDILGIHSRGSNGACAANVRWDYLRSDGIVVETGLVTYFCGQQSDGAYRVLMVEYEKPAFPPALMQSASARLKHATLFH